MSPTRGLTFERLQPAGKQTVAGMVAKGWIEKQPDGRTYCITPAGDAALKAVIPVKR
jgi:predicted transcriptional regulator